MSFFNSAVIDFDPTLFGDGFFCGIPDAMDFEFVAKARRTVASFANRLVKSRPGLRDQKGGATAVDVFDRDVFFIERNFREAAFEAFRRNRVFHHLREVGVRAKQPQLAARRIALTWLAMTATLMQVLDSTIANVALPHMQAALNGTLAGYNGQFFNPFGPSANQALVILMQESLLPAPLPVCLCLGGAGA